MKFAEIGGPQVIIVMIFVLYLWQKAKLDNVRENNHMAHSTAATDRLANATDRLANALNNIAKSEIKLADKIGDCPVRKQ